MKFIKNSGMKIIRSVLFTFAIICSTQFVNAQNSAPYLFSIEMDYAPASSGFGMALVPNFGIGFKHMWLSAGPLFGLESGYYDEKIHKVSKSDLYYGISGDKIDAYKFSQLVSGYQFGAKAFINFLLIFGQNYNNRIEDYLIFSFGLRYAFHPATVGDYLVTSSDGKYIYSEFVEVTLADAYTSLAPEIAINYDRYGIFYAYQKLSNGDPLHTFGIRFNALGSRFRN